MLITHNYVTLVYVDSIGSKGKLRSAALTLPLYLPMSWTWRRNLRTGAPLYKFLTKIGSVLKKKKKNTQVTIRKNINKIILHARLLLCTNSANRLLSFWVNDEKLQVATKALRCGTISLHFSLLWVRELKQGLFWSVQKRRICYRILKSWAFFLKQWSVQICWYLKRFYFPKNNKCNIFRNSRNMFIWGDKSHEII